jgi:putative ABC transport system ATP-binding protein/macrolide transport system ATP-binding/permease protein/lipoprotein-releasing system ATP-binding protein
VILSAQSVTQRYRSNPGYEAARDVSLDLHSGEFVSIVGRSGSGKSTLLALLGALIKPTQGRVLLDGVDVWARSDAELATIRCRHIGFVFQFPSLLPNLTAVDNVAVPALLGRTMGAEQAYRRACDFLARVGLADRADAYPNSLSGGEQRRVAIARALINTPPLLLADEPTSDLDEDTEIEIIALLEELHRTEAFGFLLVTHNLQLARHAHRVYEMRQGALVPLDLSGAAVEPQPPQRHSLPVGAYVGRELAAAGGAPGPTHLGRDLWRGAARTFLIGGAAIFAGILLVDFAVAQYQELQLRERGARLAKLAELGLASLQGEVTSISDLGDGRYELAVSLSNVSGEQAIYVMSPEMRAYVQTGKVWQEVPLTPIDDTIGSVLKIASKRIYRYLFEVRVKNFTQLLPNYMHVRFSDTMLISPSYTPRDDVFERKDNYYVYLKPFDVADETVAKRMTFAGKPPVWIPMPPH